MSLEIEHACPKCEGDQTFYRAASTMLHLGEKTKWRCTECDYGFIKINGIDSSTHNPRTRLFFTIVCRLPISALNLSSSHHLPGRSDSAR